MEKAWDPGPGPGRRWGVFAAHLGILGALLAGASWCVAEEIRAAELVYPLCILTAVVAAWVMWSWYAATGSLFDPYGIFMGAALLFNGGQAYLEIFHLNKNGILDGMLFPETVGKMLFLTVLCLLAFHGGALLAAAARKERPPAGDDGTMEVRLRCLRTVGAALLVVSLAPALQRTAHVVTTALSSGYASLYQKPAATGMEHGPALLGAFIVPATIMLLAGSRGRPWSIAMATIPMAIYALPQLLMGNRGWGIMPLLAFGWMWHRSIRPLPKTLLVLGGALTLFVVFPLIHATRNTSGDQRLSVEYLAQEFTSMDNPAVAIVAEMGTTMRATGHTLELVPGLRPFEMGMGYLYAMSTMFPNLFWDIHPAIAHGTADSWVTRTVEPIIAAQGGGLGYSFIAEAFLNFGWWGSPLILALFGFLLARFVRWADVPHYPARVAMAATFTAFFLMFARGESYYIFRPILWYALIPYLGVQALYSFSMQRRRHAAPPAQAPAGSAPARPLTDPDPRLWGAG